MGDLCEGEKSRRGPRARRSRGLGDGRYRDKNR